ncbi:MAG: hypothetical protein CMM50_03010 [Rhodospirillaceae bacterium]|nr:hypothetical protein [Rhodospirillaceae bacterium]
MRDVLETLFAMPIPVLLLMLAALLVWRWGRLRNALFVLATAVLTALSLPMVAEALSRPLAAGAMRGAEPMGRYAVVVPTAGIFVDGAGVWWPSAETIRRTAVGMTEHRSSGAALVVAGGAPLGDQPPEATVVARVMDLDGPGIRLETAARNTRETAAALAGMLGGKEGPQVVLVTSPVHFARMAASLRHHGIEVLRSPPSLVEDSPARGWMELLPSAVGLAQSRAALHEYAAILTYLIRGDIALGDL